MIAALATRSPIFVWKDIEVEQVAKRIQDVSKHYDLEELVSGKKTSLVMLAGTVGTIIFQKALIVRAANAMKAAPPEAPASPDTAAATNAGLANGTYDLTGEHLKGIHVP